ncbi:hypothetical protein EV701_12853 [Chthoniobacter flavus]|nr:hypothetical protein EV701_12853 [Chthoniobacter flavus]
MIAEFGTRNAQFNLARTVQFTDEIGTPAIPHSALPILHSR